MDLQRADLSPDEFERLSMSVRMYCAAKLHDLVESMRPYVDGSFGEVTPGHVQAYLAGVKELGRLFQAQQAPTAGGVDPARVAVLVEAARLEGVAAGAAAEAARLEEGRRVELGRAREVVESALVSVRRGL